MRRTNRLIRSMDGPIRVMGQILNELRIEIDKTTRDLQEEFSLVDTGLKHDKLPPVPEAKDE